MNLENLNLVELNAHEAKETEGGFLPLIILAVVAVCSSSCVPCPAPPRLP